MITSFIVRRAEPSAAASVSLPGRDVFCDHLTDWIKLLHAMLRQRVCHTLSSYSSVRR